MRSIRAASLLVILMLVAPTLAGVKVAFEETVDFSRYETYARGEGTPAARPHVQEWIDAAVDRELQAKGMRKVPPAEADLVVVTVAYAQMSTVMRGNYVHLDRYDVGIISGEIVGTTSGHLLVDLIDARTQEPVWRGVANEAIKNESPAKVQKKIDKIARKLFKQFPR